MEFYNFPHLYSRRWKGRGIVMPFGLPTHSFGQRPSFSWREGFGEFWGKESAGVRLWTVDFIWRATGSDGRVFRTSDVVIFALKLCYSS